jgi:selenocysteine lyase/cysteine desulfurase
MVGCIGLGASLELLRRLGVTSSHSTVAEAVLELAAEAESMLKSRGAELISPCFPGHDSGIITFRVPDRNPHELRKACLAAGVALSVRGGGIRISLHGYNNRDDLARLCSVVFD